MENFLAKIKEKAKACPATIVFPEGDEHRIVKAADRILNEKIAKPLLLGDPAKIKETCEKEHINPAQFADCIVDFTNSKLKKELAAKLYELRKHKTGMTLQKAEELIETPPYFGTMLVHNNFAEAMIGGVRYSTAETVRPALQIIKTKEKFHKVSGVFIMIHEERTMLFADAAINVNPNSYDLAEIAIDTAETALRFNITPKIALLSFSTVGSGGKHPYIDKIREATAIIKDRRPDLIVEGEMQVDAAIVPEVAKIKCPDAAIQGDANVLIFPTLDAANIAYKLVERLGKAKAIGPVLQGLKKPINDLSRGCSVDDLVNIAAITSIEVCEGPLH